MVRAGCLGALAIALLAGCSSDTKTIVEPPPTPPPPPPAVLPGVYELSGLTTSLPTSDLEPLREIVGNAQFVALGESTHTSAGYYQAKARLVRFMVEKMGYRVLAWETPWLQAKEVSQYVASCTGKVETAMAGMFRVWQDANVRDLLKWLCEYNRANPSDPVTFYGFDIQEPWESAPALEQFILDAAPAQTARMEPIRRCLGATHGSDQFFLSQDWIDHTAGRRNNAAHEDCLRGITEAEAWIAANVSSLQGSSSPSAVEEARLYLVALRAMEQALWLPDDGSYQARDFAMAQMITRLHAL